MNISIQHNNSKTSNDMVLQRNWAQREIDAIIACAHNLFEDASVRSNEFVDTVRCEGGEPAWYRPSFRSERRDDELMDTLHTRLKAVVENVHTQFSHYATHDDAHVAFFTKLLAQSAAPRTKRHMLLCTLRIWFYAAKLVARRLTT